MENRLKQLRRELRLTQEAMAGRMGIGKSALSMIETGKAALSRRNRDILAREFNANPLWLDTGEGEMLTSAPFDACTADAEMAPMQKIPLYDAKTARSLSRLLSDPSAHTPVSCVAIPGLGKCDGAVYVTGDGMYPLLNSGDIVIYKRIGKMADIFWGEMYLLSVDIDGEEHTAVKYVHKSDRPGCVRLSGQNPANGDKDVEFSKITAIAFIRASIRLHSIG